MPKRKLKTKVVSPGTKKERTRAALIAAATAVVQQKGFAAASLDEIAARAGMTKGAIYSNFADKADLMFEVGASMSQRVASLPEPSTLAEGLQRAALAFAGLLSEGSALWRLQADFLLYVAGEPTLAKRVARVHSELFDHAEREIQTLYGDQLVIKPRALVLAAQALGHGFTYQSVITPGEVKKETITTAFAALAAGAIRKD